jgi:hypothetical protein
MYDLRLVPFFVRAGSELALSALPDAPVVPDERPRGRRRPRRQATRLER